MTQEEFDNLQVDDYIYWHRSTIRNVHHIDKVVYISKLSKKVLLLQADGNLASGAFHNHLRDGYRLLTPTEQLLYVNEEAYQ